MIKLMTKLFIIFIFLIYSSSILISQFNVTGRVLDGKTKEALSFANIEFNSGRTVSDISGNFKFRINQNHLKLKVKYIGYISFELDTIISGNRLDLGIIFLKEDVKSLNEVTITSGKYQKSIKEAVVALETIKPEFLENNNTQVFSGILEKIPGVNYIDGQVNIRGGSGFSYGAGSRVMVLIDNIPALQFDSGYPNWENIPVERIAKVEVMKGAGSALYGSAAMNGVINVLSVYAKEKLKLKFKTFYSFYNSPSDPVKKWWDSSPKTYGFSGLFAKKIKKLDIIGSFYYHNEDDIMKYGFNNYGRITTKLDYHVNDALKIGVDVNYNKGRKLNFFYWMDEKEGAYKADTAAAAGQDKQIVLVDPYLVYYGKKGIKHTIQSRIYSAQNIVTGSKSNKSLSLYGEYQFQKRFSQIGLILTSGLVANFSHTNAELYGDSIFTANNYGIYLQMEKKFWDKLNLVAGARYETNEITGPVIINGKDVRDKYKKESEPVFRFGANYSLFKYTNLRASWGQGFRYPTIAEKFTSTYSGNLYIYPNPDLHAEKGYTVETGIRQGLKFGKFKGFIDFSVFQSEYKDMIEFALNYDPGRKIFYFAAENIGNTIIKGYEFSSGVLGKIGDMELNFIGGFMHINPKYKDFTDEVKKNLSVDYNILKYRYKNSYKFDIGLKYKSFSIGFGSNFNSFMEAIDKIFESDQFFKGVKKYRTGHNQGSNIYRLRAGYNYKPFEFRFNIDNLFNTEYSVRPGLLEPPRKYTFSLIFDL